jgi:hypothetical protein
MISVIPDAEAAVPEVITVPISPIVLPELRRVLKQPETCVYTLIGVLSALIDVNDLEGPRRDIRPELYRACKDAFSLAFAWISQPRSLSSLKQLQDMKCACQRDTRFARNDAMWHKLGRMDYEKKWCLEQAPEQTPPISAILIITLCPLFNLYEQQDIPRLRELEKRTTWPTSVLQILPHGPEATVRGLLVWFKLKNSARMNIALLETLHMLSTVCTARVIPCMTLSSSFLMGGITDTINDIQTKTERLMSEGHMDVGWMHRSIHDMLFLSRFINRLLVCDMDLNQKQVFLHSYSSRLLQALTYGDHACALFEGIISYLTSSPTPDTPPVDPSLSHNIAVIRAVYADLAAMIFVDFLTPDDPPVPMSPEFEANILPVIRDVLADEQEGVMRSAFLAMYRLGHYERCWALHCPRTAADSKLRHCSGCLRVSYCSRKCQKRAWNLTSNIGSHRARKFVGDFKMPMAVCSGSRGILIQTMIKRGTWLLKFTNTLLNSLHLKWMYHVSSSVACQCILDNELYQRNLR